MGFFDNVRKRVGEWLFPSPEQRRLHDFQQQIVTPLTQLQQKIATTAHQLQSKKINTESVVSWTQRTDTQEQCHEIMKQLASHDRQSWLVRSYKVWTGQAKDIADKRLWLAYQQCQSVNIHQIDISKNNLEVVAIYNAIRRLRGFKYYLSDWQNSIRNVQAVRYLQKWPQLPKPVNDISSTRHLESRSDSPVEQSKSETHNQNSSEGNLSNALVLFKTSTTAPKATAPKERNLRLMLRACGFFDIDVNIATPIIIRQKLREILLKLHPDKLNFTFIDVNGKQNNFSEMVQERYQKRMSELFQSLINQFNSISPEDILLTKLIKRFSQREIKKIIKEGKYSREDFDRAVNGSKRTATTSAYVEDARIKREASIAELNEGIEALKREIYEFQQEQEALRRQQNCANQNTSSASTDILRTKIENNDGLIENSLFARPQQQNGLTAANQPVIVVGPQSVSKKC